jgi:hypothetical protein
MRPVFALLSVLLVGMLAYGYWYQRALPAAVATEDMAVGDMVPLPDNAAIEPKAVRTVYLNREGARLRPSPRDDARRNLSSIVHASGLEQVDIPAFAAAPARWDTIVRCIQSKFQPFDVQIVDRRPVDDEYIMAVMGGRPDLIAAKTTHTHGGKVHEHANATGLAPYNGRAIPNAVVLIFTRALKEEARPTCETAAMEIAHAYGLDHARHCGDIMTYMRPCGAKQFLDKDLRCGEHEDRLCGDGQPTQNAHARLLALLGARVAP